MYQKVVDILNPKEHQIKFSSVDFVGPLFLVMLMIFVKDVKCAKRLKIYQEGIKCLYVMFMFVKFFIYGALISWEPSFGYTYILVLVDYVSKWVEAVATKADDAKTIVKHAKFLILHRYGVPRAIISDRGTHF